MAADNMNFQSVDPQGQITHETLIFKDDGAEAVTCPADDPINVRVCLFPCALEPFLLLHQNNSG